MKTGLPEIQGYITSMLDELSRDWDHAGPITAETGLFAQLGLESLDAVILATAVQEHFGCQMPFARLFAEIGEQQRDLTVGELAEFIHSHVNPAATAGTTGANLERENASYRC
jgi:acyl carrier protein